MTLAPEKSDAIAELATALRLSDPPAVSDMRTICEVLRELGRDAEIRGDIVSLRKILEATQMAKRMARKLVEYSENELGLAP